MSWLGRQIRGAVATGATNPAMRVSLDDDGELVTGDDALTDVERAEWQADAWRPAVAVAAPVVGGIVTVATGGNVAAGSAAGAGAGAFAKSQLARSERVLARERELAAARAANERMANGGGMSQEPWDRSLWPRPAGMIRAQANRTLAALVQVESGGNPDAISPSGKHFGLLQMGHDRARDVGIEDARTLLGNPELAVQAAVASLKRSAHVHQWIPVLVAISWKGGTGTLKKFLRLAQTQPPAQALEDSAPESWRMAEYVRRFTRAYQ